MRHIGLCLVLLACAAAQTAAAVETATPATRMVGGETDYTVQPGDTLSHIGARFGTEVASLARLNGLPATARLKPGDIVKVDNRHLVPESMEAGILINIPQRMLYYFQSGQLAAHYPVGLGRPDWETPRGSFTVLVREKNPTWDVPVSIQEEMRREGKEVITRVPPGPANPLGSYWLGLSLPGIGIHGTIAPSSVYKFRSHGCIRLHPDDIDELFQRIVEQEPGKIIYMPVLLAQLADGHIMLEVHRDVYKRGGNPLKRAQDLAAQAGITDLIDWEQVLQVIKDKEGLARAVNLPAAGTEETGQ